MLLRPGDALGRYVIDGVIGHGGMGVVYRAQDTRLHRPVALKVLAAEKVGGDGRSSGGSARILREARIAAKLDHPNVVAIYDVDEITEGECAGVAYLAMELVEGRSLRACIGDHAIPLAMRLRWLIEVARGLAAAHDRGLVHRDVKPENIVVRSDGVAKVLDFGIAKELPAPSDALRVTSPLAESLVQATTSEGIVIGTPYYMSPEQMKGNRVGPRSDQFSWGVVAYELLCGVPPWGTAAAPVHVVAAILGTDPTDPHAVNPEVPGWLAAIVLRAMAKPEGLRFRSMHEAITRLEKGASGAHGLPGRAARWRLAVVIGAALVAGGALIRADRPEAARGPPALEGKPRVAVLGLRGDRKESLPWAGTALSAMIGTELAASGELRVSPSERVAEASRELGLDDAPDIDGAALLRIHANLGADYVVTGSYAAESEAGDATVRATVALEDARTGEVVARASAGGTASKLPDLAASLSGPLRVKLGTRAPTTAQEGAARASSASNPAAVEAFSEGEERMRRTDFAGARDAFERAVAADPAYPLAHSALSEALAKLGEEPRAVEEARKAFESSGATSRELQLLVEARYRGAAKDWGRAAQIYHALVEFFPDRVDYGCAYAGALDRGGDTNAALAALDRLRTLPPPDGDDPGIDLLESTLADHIGDETRSLAAARAALPKAIARGQTMNEANARRLVGETLWSIDHVDAGEVELQRARALFEQLGEKVNLSTTLAELAGIQAQRGRPLDALPLEEHALALVRQLGDRFHMAVRLRRVGDTYDELGDPGRARPLWEESRAVFVSIHDARGDARLEGRLGIALREEGDSAGARARLVDARDRSRALGDRVVTMEQEHEIAVLAVETGDLAEAERANRAEAELALAVEDKLAGADATLTRASIALEKGDATGSLAAAEDAKARFEQVQGKLGSLRAQLLLARLALAGGRSADAGEPVLGAVDAFHAGGYRGYEAAALATLALVFVAEGKSADASNAIERATSLAPQAIGTSVDVELARAAVLSASHDASAAGRTLPADGRARAENAGFLPRAWEARIAAARELDGAARKRELAVVASQAHRAGYERIARLALGPPHSLD